MTANCATNPNNFQYDPSRHSTKCPRFLFGLRGSNIGSTNRKVFFESSPISYATVDKNSTRFLLVHGTNDDVVDSATQSTAFLTPLKQAQFVARTIVVPGAGHFWITDPIEPGSFGAYAGPKALLLLKAWL